MRVTLSILAAVMACLTAASGAPPADHKASSTTASPVTVGNATTIAGLIDPLVLAHLRSGGARDLAKAGEYRELADRLYIMADNGIGAGGLNPPRLRFRAAAVNLYANDLERSGLAASRQAGVLSRAGAVLTVADGLLTSADRYRTTGDVLRSLLAGGAQAAIGTLTRTGSAGIGVACDLVFDEQRYPTAQPLCTFAGGTLFSADHYADGVSQWIKRGADDAGGFLKRPSAGAALTGTGAWLRDGTKGALETAFGIGVGFGSALRDTAVRVLNPGRNLDK